MIRKLLKKVLGLDETERRIANLERDKAGLEERVIKAEEQRALVVRAVRKSVVSFEISDEAERFLAEVNVQLTEKNSGAVLTSLEAVDIVKKYGFERYMPPVETAYPSSVITIREFQGHPERYFHKLGKGFLSFPIAIDFDAINLILEREFGNIRLSTQTMYSNNGCFEFVLSSLFRQSPLSLKHEEEEKADKANELMVQSANIARLNRVECRGWVHMDTLDFLVNYDRLIRFIEGLNVSDDAKERAIKAMALARFSYLTAVEVAGTTRIRNLSELLTYDEEEEPHIVTGELQTASPSYQLKQKLKLAFLLKQEGASYNNIEKLLSIRSYERFRRLASEVTSRILANDRERKGLTVEIDKPLEEYSVGEAIILACYFARNVITRYRTLEDSVREIFFSGSEMTGEVTGKCTDYTGLALHYLREYLAPMQPDKFRNWQFGAEKDNIGDYNHCYIKATHINPDLTADVFFADPTKLASRGIDELRLPSKLVEGLDTRNLPLMIERDAEDLLVAAKEKMPC